MDLGLTGKNAFVAGSSKGLGLAVAMELAKEGANLVICSRNQKKLDEAKQELTALGSGDVFVLQGDVSVESERNFLIKASLDRFEHIDILVTNSGGPPPGNFEDFEKEDWDAAYELLLGSAVGLIKGFLAGMKANGWGRIITISSQAVKQPVDKLVLSNAVRSSVVGLMKTLSNELGPFNITVNNVMPGYTETDRLKSLLSKNPALANAVDEIPLGRFGKPDEFAAAVAFLASERASYISGISLAVDGGWIKGV